MKLILSDHDERIVEHSPAPVEQILLEAGINPLDVLVSRNGNLISEDTVVEDEDEIRVIRIAHGG
jgi:sulfur carrier protein